MKTAQLLSDIAGAITAARTILVATHVYPDADALGSQLAMGDILESLGKKVTLYGEDTIPYLYEFLPGCEKLQSTLPELETFDCIIALDCGDLARLGTMAKPFTAIHPFILIDHHTGHTPFGDIRWVDSGRAATGEMVYDLATALGVDISYQAAYCLYTAIVSDTGSFKYSSTTTDTFRVARELIAKGVKPSEVAGKLFDNFSVNRLQLLKLVLSSLELHSNDQLAFIHVTREMFDETATTGADTEMFINYPRSLSTVKVAVFIKESKENLISVSLRSKGHDYDVAEIAGQFGGGGHRNAAGFKLRDTTIAATRRQLLESLLPLVETVIEDAGN